MSTLLVESPVLGSQLLFPWAGPATASAVEVIAAQAAAEASVTEDCDVPPEAIAVSHRFATPARELPTRPAELLRENRREVTHFDRTERLERPVRMGSVMIKLLKRYGITDQEISEGLESYAAKTCQQLAS